MIQAQFGWKLLLETMVFSFSIAIPNPAPEQGLNTENKAVLIKHIIIVIHQSEGFERIIQVPGCDDPQD